MCNRLAALENYDIDVDAMKFSRADSALRCEGFPTFQELILSPYSGCTGGLVEPKLMTRCPTVCCVYLRSPRCRMECDSSGWWKES